MGRGKLEELYKKARAKVESTSRRLITEAYWSLCYEEDEHNERLAVFYFKPDTDDDVVVAKVEETMTRMGNETGRVTRHKRKTHHG